MVVQVRSFPGFFRRVDTDKSDRLFLAVHYDCFGVAVIDAKDLVGFGLNDAR
jgi:hypothetical protein